MNKEYFGGLDFGSSGVRICIITYSKEIIYEGSYSYRNEFKNPEIWISSCIELFKKIPLEIKRSLSKLSIVGTSGTLVPCQLDGKNIGNSMPYNKICLSNKNMLNQIVGEDKFLNNPYSSLAKALELIEIYGDNILLRHQSDWISGWFLNNWRYGEEGNNIKLGWDIAKQSWPNTFNSLSLKKCIPFIKKSGSTLGKIDRLIAKKLQINNNLSIIAGTTDSNAAFIATEVKEDEGLTILGTTMVLKKLIKNNFSSPGVTIHRVKGDWICGGSSNAGCGVLSKYFSDFEIDELSRQINPKKNTTLNYLPLNSVGERFPVDNPLLEPILEPRPVSDALFLHGLFEGLAKIELKGWEKLEKLTGTFPKKIITIGGGAKNPQWRSIREKFLKRPIKNSKKTTSYGSALIALNAN